jgi:tetratricopeptide (TPR) repeat protein
MYRAQGDYPKASPLYRRSLAILEKGLGPEHPQVATVLNQLGWTYHAQKLYPVAESFYQRALAILERALRPDHSSLIEVLENYAALLRQTNRKEQAGRTEARARTIRAKHGPPS